jgi:hypothetical protein
VDAAGWGIVIAVILGVPTLWFAYRATRVGEQTLKLERQRELGDKLARLELIGSQPLSEVWNCMGRTDDQTAWFDAEVRNRGPAHALELHWSASIDPDKVGMEHSQPDRLYVMDEQQV